MREVQVAYRVAERRACRVLGFSRTTYRYRSRRDPRAELRIRLRDLAASRVHYGYPRLWVLLRREGWLVNKKLVYRLYREEGLGIRRRKPRRRDVARVLEQVTSHRGKPQSIRVDNGPEFISRSLGMWASFNGVKLDFSRPGKPTDNAAIESFNGRLRDECLNQHWVLSLDEARAVTEAWREDYNRVRPHGALGNRTPSEFARPVDGHAHLPALHG